MRGVRLQLEYEKAEQRLRAWTVRSTVVVFGSARVLPQGSGDPSVSTATLPVRAAPRPDDQSARWYEEARRFGRIVSERGGALIADHGVRDNVIATGGGPAAGPAMSTLPRKRPTIVLGPHVAKGQ
jgi:predicted Rossmann-fold nucleotide-binding protein